MTLRAARSGALLLVLLCAAPEAGCAERQSAPVLRSPFEARLTLEREGGAAAVAFATGETLVLVLTVRNPTDVPQSLPLPSAQTHDFAISTPDGREVWRWSAGRMFAQMLTDLAFAPGEEKSFRGIWSQRGADGAPAPPGRYRASGWVGPRGSGMLAEAVDFRIAQP